MSVFVDKKKTFRLSIYWRPVEYNGQEIDVEISTSPKEGWKEFWGDFRSADADTFGKILARTTIINSADQKPLLNTHLLMINVLGMLMSGWSHFDEHGNQFPVTEEAIRDLNYKVAVGLFVQYMNKTKLTPVLREAVKQTKEIGTSATPQMPPGFSASRPQPIKASSQPPWLAAKQAGG